MTRSAISGGNPCSPRQSPMVAPLRKCPARWSTRSSQVFIECSQKPQRDGTAHSPIIQSSSKGMASRRWNNRRCWTRWSFRRKERGLPESSRQYLWLWNSKCSGLGSSALQNAQYFLPVAIEKTVVPRGAQYHASGFR